MQGRGLEDRADYEKDDEPGLQLGVGEVDQAEPEGNSTFPSLQLP